MSALGLEAVRNAWLLSVTSPMTRAKTNLSLPSLVEVLGVPIEKYRTSTRWSQGIASAGSLDPCTEGSRFADHCTKMAGEGTRKQRRHSIADMPFLITIVPVKDKPVIERLKPCCLTHSD